MRMKNVEFGLGFFGVLGKLGGNFMLKFFVFGKGNIELLLFFIIFSVVSLNCLYRFLENTSNLFFLLMHKLT